MAKSKPTAPARQLRQRATPAEKAVWALLRTRPADLKFRRQHPIGPYIVDFACPAASLVIELDGGSHTEPGQIATDEKRTAYLESQGWTVLRFWNPQDSGELDGVVSAIISYAETCRRGRSPLT